MRSRPSAWAGSAVRCLRQLRQGDSAAELARHERKLGWAAQLHEIGSLISHGDYHKHGAYILDNTDALGFALTELHRLSLLVLGHRGKLRKLERRLRKTSCSFTNCCACGWRSSCAMRAAIPT